MGCVLGVLLDTLSPLASVMRILQELACKSSLESILIVAEPIAAFQTTTTLPSACSNVWPHGSKATSPAQPGLWGIARLKSVAGIRKLAVQAWRYL
jgi:hypothetical protein